MDEHWETLTFGDLVPGDVVRLDEEGPEETVRSASQRYRKRFWFRTDLSAGFRVNTDPVLVRFPRPEVEA